MNSVSSVSMVGRCGPNRRDLDGRSVGPESLVYNSLCFHRNDRNVHLVLVACILRALEAPVLDLCFVSRKCVKVGLCRRAGLRPGFLTKLAASNGSQTASPSRICR